MDQLEQFERYSHAVAADRYRVTCIRMHEDGSRQTLILDKKDGITRGFTPEEVRQHMQEMLRLQRRGENIYYTPLSERKHHILVDDLDRAKLERFIADGYQPAVLIESSPARYQAVITIPKLGTPHDKDVANRIASVLNREYGDPNLSGAIHPHRAPGFENRKPKYRREDGTYPVVRLLKSERRECSKTLALSKEIAAEYTRQASTRSQQGGKFALETTPSGSSAIEAYYRHYQDIMARHTNADLSRVDAMIAVRMRVTGHDQAAIEHAIRQCAPTIRQDATAHRWDDYAQRTAQYAFSPAGDRRVVELSRYREKWERLERRETAVERDLGMSL